MIHSVYMTQLEIGHVFAVAQEVSTVFGMSGGICTNHTAVMKEKSCQQWPQAVNKVKNNLHQYALIMIDTFTMTSNHVTLDHDENSVRLVPLIR